ncbi:MAG: CoB--CoM heterodisulfide reductase iron-sulfur subunit A family protein [Thermoplasmatales archaeon]|nr:CoB--CoM heterodisulfide reductase iron-sulfur subunit A family protein [Thermoplasmatales archaeon]
MVIGGGIAGIQASLDLADRDIHVYLVEKEPTIGGKMSRLDKTFPTNDCSACILSPKMADCAGHPNITLMTYSEVIKVDGKAGDFKVTVNKKARYVNPDECTGCGDCMEKCPSKNIPDEFEFGLTTRKAIYIPHAQAVPRVAIIDPNHCRKILNDKCGLCFKNCQKGAINYEDKDVQEVLDVGSIIVAAGFEVWDAGIAAEYGYGRYADVVTAMEYERMMCASGPDGGHILRRSNGKAPKKVAFIQCCGSRSEKEGWQKYCSSVCCMYATKQAILTREHDAEVAQDIFFMDIRSYGKEFEGYIHRAEDEYGVKMHRGSRVSNVSEDPKTKELIVSYVDADGNPVDAKYDLVVLSIGLNPPKGGAELAKVLGIELNEYGFCDTTVFEPLATSREGVFVAGAYAAPKDIPTTVAESSGASAKAGAHIVGADFKPCEPKVYPAEKDVAGEEPRIGVWVCSCGTNIGGVVDVPAVAKYAEGLPGVVSSMSSMYACAQGTLQEISETIKEKNLNRVVVASCTPRTHEPLFRGACREGGLNQYLFNMANIRDQCSWIHMHEPEAATKKAKDLLRMAVAKAALFESLDEPKVPVTNAAAVIGGGVTGMNTALDIAAQGFPVHLVERADKLGGFALNFTHKENGRKVSDYVAELVKKVESDKNITVHLNSEVEDIPGYVGNFEVHMKGGKKVEVGAVILAVGASPYKPTEFNYGKDDKVKTGLEVEALVDAGSFKGKDVAFIQCVGSRNDKVKYCSRVCCASALRNAIKIKLADPTANVTVFHKDIRTYGFREDLYKKACEVGVMFVRYRENDPLPGYDGKAVKAYDTVLNKEVSVPVDTVVLSVGVQPDREEKEKIAQMLSCPISKDGFYFEAHQKLRPVDFATEGVYVAGTAHWPKFLDECISQASGAASRSLTVISKDNVTAEGIIATVNEKYCDGCGVCEGCCEYNAITIVEKDGKLKSSVNAGLCKGCGSCVAACPSGAMEQKGFTNAQIRAEIDAFFGSPAGGA